MSEFRHAWRGLIRRPAYAIATVGTLAIVIGVNAALFAAINVTLLRPIALKSGERTVQIYLLPPRLSDPKYRNPLHAIDLVRFRERSRTLTHIAAFTIAERVLGTGTDVDVVSTLPTNAEMLRLSIDTPLLGRVFSDAEERHKDAVMVLSYGAWQRRFGGDRGIVGRKVQLDGDPYTIIGVMPQTFPPTFLDAELWTPLGVVDSAPANEARTSLVTIAQLADGVTFAQAEAEVHAIVGDLARELPLTHQGWTGGLNTFREWQYGTFRAPLLVLFIAVLVLLLIASSNIASLTLAHVTARADEFALRRAIGASRWDIARLMLAETAMINGVGAALALLAGAWLLPWLLAIAPAATQALGHVTMDWHVAAYAFALALLSSLMAGVLPAVKASDVGLAFSASTMRSSGSRERHSWQTTLLVGQTALCVALLIAGGLLVRALVRSSRVAPGYDPTHVLTAQLQLPPSRYATGPERVAAMQQLFERMASIPGVVQAGATMNRFLPGFSYTTQIEIEKPTPDGSGHACQFRRVSATYFATMRIRLRRGRVFDARDSLSTPTVGVVSQSFADRYWPDADPIGRRLKRGQSLMTVVGVVDDVSDVDLLQPPEPTLYAAWTQTANVAFPMGLVLRRVGDPESAAPALRAAVSSIDPLLALDRIQSLDTFLADSLAPQRFRTTLMIGLAIVGLLLGAIGTAGVTARTIADRMPEFGVRLALGCDQSERWRGAVIQQLRVVGIGSVAGLALSVVVCKTIASMLPETAGVDPVVMAGSVAALVSTAALAAAVPASRVMWLNPLAILRSN
jgi:putative ABC transport system permease protein